MKSIPGRLRVASFALAIALLAPAAALASDCYTPAGSNQCFPTNVLVDPATGQPYKASGGSGGGGGSTGSVTAAGANGTQAQAVQGINGGVPLAVTWSGALPVNNSQINGVTIATGAGASNAGTQRTILATDQPALPVTGTFFQPTQPVSEADGSNATLGSKADAASAASGSTAMAIFRQLHLDAIAPTPAGTNIIGKVGFDSAANGVSIADGGSAALGSTADPAATLASTSGTAISWLRAISGGAGYTNATPYTGSGVTSAVGALKGIYALQAAPIGVTTTSTSVTIGTAGTFNPTAALAASTTRKGCFLQYKGTGTGYVAVGPTSAPSNLNNAIQLAAGNTVSCQIAGNVVDQSNIWVTSTTAGELFTVNSQ